MYLKFEEEFYDPDLEFLRDLFVLLDSRLSKLQASIEGCTDPDQMGLYDEAEYLAGMGFVACQRYMSSTYGQSKVTKNAALFPGPYHKGGESFAHILNAAANYWKHVDEWSTDATLLHDVSRLAGKHKDKQKNTIRVIESVTSWSDCTCANLLFALTAPVVQFSALISVLEEWRQQLEVEESVK